MDTQTISLRNWQSLNGENAIGIFDLESLSSAYISAEQDESGALFRKGEAMLEAVANRVVTRYEAIGHCASLSRRTRRCVADYYLTAEVFSPETRNPELHHSLHTLCARTDNSHAWLEFASQDYTDENGQRRQHTWRTLKEAIQVSGGKVDKARLRYLMEAVSAKLEIGIGGKSLYLYFGEQLPDEFWRHGLQVKVWIAVEDHDG